MANSDCNMLKCDIMFCSSPKAFRWYLCLLGLGLRKARCGGARVFRVHQGGGHPNSRSSVWV